MTVAKPADSQPVDCIRLLNTCGSTPNCVSSLADSQERHFVAPLVLSVDDPEQDWQLLIEVISCMPRIRIVAQQSNYLHAECRSRFIGFIDDLELCYDRDSRVCHIRSASRSGYYDFNVNKKRVEAIRRAL